MPRGAGRLYVSVCGYNRSCEDWSRMRRERGLKNDDGWSELFLIARTALTSGETRGFIKGEKWGCPARRKYPPYSPIATYILPIWCCCCCHRWWWCSKRNLRDFPPVKANSPPCILLGCGDTSRIWRNAELSLFVNQKIQIKKIKNKCMDITTHIPHCGNKVNRRLNQQHGCVDALPSL